MLLQSFFSLHVRVDFNSENYFSPKLKVDVGLCRTSNTGIGVRPILGVPANPIMIMSWHTEPQKTGENRNR